MYRIMVVDDEDYILKALNRVLATRPDWEVETYTDAATALRRARTTVFDAVITDYRMPDMDGIAVLEQMRPNLPDLPVIVLTAQGGVDTAVKAMRAGANDFVIKPPNPERLRVSIGNALKVGALTGQLDRLSRKMTGELGFTDLIAVSPAMMKVRHCARTCSRRWTRRRRSPSPSPSPAARRRRWPSCWPASPTPARSARQLKRRA